MIARMSPVVLTVVSTLFACGMTPLFAQTEVGLTLDQALTEALVQNPSLAVERHEIGIAAGTLRQARLYPLNPELEFEGSAGRGRGCGGEDARRSLNGQGIGLSQTIWLRGQRGFRIQAAEAGVDRAAAGVQNAEREVIGETLQAFGEILVAQERLALARDLVALATDVRGSAVKLFEADAVPQLDVLRAEVELTKAQNRVVAEERALTTAQRALALLLARPTNQAIRAEAPLSLPLPSGELASLQQTALERRPDLVGARAAVRAAEAELALVRAERFFPEMRVGLKYDQAQEFDSTNRSGLLALAVPLPILNRRQGEVDRALGELGRQEATVQLIQRQIETDVATAYQQVVASRRISDAYTSRILPDQNRNFQMLREGYNIGQLTITDVLVGQRELIDAREAYLDAAAVLNAAAAALYRALNHTQSGQRVTKGQDRIEVQSVEVEKLELDLMQAENKYQAERAKLELDLTQAENKRRLAQTEADRNRSLVEKGVGARKELITAENELQAVTNEIAELKRQLQLLAQTSQNEIAGLTRQLELLGLPAKEIARVRREKIVTLLHIPAPLGGVIVERPVSLGQIIETTTTLFRIIDDSIIIAEGDAFEDMLPALRVGQRVRLMVAAYPKRIFDGTLTFIHPVIDPEKRTAHIWAQLSNPDSELKPDMFAQLNVVIGGGSPVVTIPADAVMAAEGEEFVFVERDGGLARVAIVTGARNDQFIEVKRGLHAGDRVVTDGKRQVYTKLLTMRSGGAALGGHTH